MTDEDGIWPRPPNPAQERTSREVMAKVNVDGDFRDAAAP